MLLYSDSEYVLSLFQRYLFHEIYLRGEVVGIAVLPYAAACRPLGRTFVSSSLCSNVFRSEYFVFEEFEAGADIDLGVSPKGMILIREDKDEGK